MLGYILGAANIGKDHKSSYTGVGSAARWLVQVQVYCDYTKQFSLTSIVIGFQEHKSIEHNSICNQLGREKVSLELKTKWLQLC